MIEFRSETRWRTAGAPRLFIHPEIKTWMDQSYAQGEVCELPMEENADSADFVKLLKHYARQQGKAACVQFFTEEGVSKIRFKMRDKRSYTRPTTLARERR